VREAVSLSLGLAPGCPPGTLPVGLGWVRGLEGYVLVFTETDASRKGGEKIVKEKGLGGYSITRALLDLCKRGWFEGLCLTGGAVNKKRAQDFSRVKDLDQDEGCRVSSERVGGGRKKGGAGGKKRSERLARGRGSGERRRFSFME